MHLQSVTFPAFFRGKCARILLRSFLGKLRADDDVVDGNVNKFDKESDEAHDSESNSGSNGDLLEFWKRK